MFKYERILQHCVTVTKDKCDSVRASRNRIDIIQYKELVDSVYFPFVFTYMKEVIDEQVASEFSDDELLVAQYRNSIFSQCRDMCVELYREIPNDELIKANLEKQNSQVKR